ERRPAARQLRAAPARGPAFRVDAALAGDPRPAAGPFGGLLPPRPRRHLLQARCLRSKAFARASARCARATASISMSPRAARTGPWRQVLEEVGLEERMHVLAGNLAHGEQRSLEVAMALATRPRLLLLDEPMAGMGADESQRMIGLLSSLKRRQTIVLVEHDMDAVFRLADRIAVLVYGRVIASDSPEKIKMN